MSSLASRIGMAKPGKPNEKPANRGVHPRPYSVPAGGTPKGTRGFHPHPFAVKTRTPPAQAQFDELLIWVLIALLALGLVMVYSASIATAEASKFTGYQPPITWCGMACSSLRDCCSGCLHSRCRCRCGRPMRPICS